MKPIQDKEYGIFMFEADKEDLLHGYCNYFAECAKQYYEKQGFKNLRLEALRDDSKDENSFSHEYLVVNNRYFVDVRGVFDTKNQDPMDFYKEFLEYDHIDPNNIKIDCGYGIRFDIEEFSEEQAAMQLSYELLEQNPDQFRILPGFDKMQDMKTKIEEYETKENKDFELN